MSSVGPQLPPHLAKRKRGDNEPPNSPRKVQATTAPEIRVVGPALPPTTNADELDIGDSSEDDYGPSIPSAKAPGPDLPPQNTTGPTLPSTTNPDEVDLESDSSEDDYRPSIPQFSAQTKASSPPPKKKVLGPAPPPANLSEMPSHSATNDSDSSSDDDYGPSLPPAPGSAAEAQQQDALQQEREAEAAAASAPKKLQRDEWMLAPPDNSDWGSRVDPTKLKNRKFASGKGAKAPAEKGGGISALWTETPDEKRKRLADEVLGRTEVSLNSTSKSSKPRVESKEDKETERRIREYNERNRGESLLEKRTKDGGQKEEDDDPSKRGFDREKDMALGGLGRVEKRDMLAKAKDFGTRFQKGSFL